LVLFLADVSISHHISSLFVFVQPFLIFKLTFFLIEQFFVVSDEVEHFSHVLAYLQNILVSSGDDLCDVLPFLKQLMTFIMFFLELFSSLVHLDLSGLCGGDLFIKFLLFATHFDCKFFDLKVEFSNFGVILLSIFLKGDMIFFFLFAGNGPLFKFFLIPVEF
jgi:hypothetical protein